MSIAGINDTARGEQANAHMLQITQCKSKNAITDLQFKDKPTQCFTLYLTSCQNIFVRQSLLGPEGKENAKVRGSYSLFTFFGSHRV